MWDKIDLVALVWAIPTTRMKVQREHRVPLFRRAVEILDATGAAPAGSCSAARHGRPMTGIVKLTKSSAIDPQDIELQPVSNPPC